MPICGGTKLGNILRENLPEHESVNIWICRRSDVPPDWSGPVLNSNWRNAANVAYMIAIFRESELPHPPTILRSHSYSDSLDFIPPIIDMEFYALLGKPRYEEQGKGIVFRYVGECSRERLQLTALNLFDEYPNLCAVSQFLPPNRIFRVSATVWPWKRAQVWERIPTRQALYVIRNWSNGWIQRLIPIDTAPDRLKELGWAALEAVQLEWGAVDIIQYDGEYYVLEVNSAPGIQSEISKQFWIRRGNELIEALRRGKIPKFQNNLQS